MSIKEHPPLHVPVLLNAVLDTLKPIQGENYLDLTAGYGGHARAILAKTENYEESWLVDRDDNALSTLTDLESRGSHMLNSDFVSSAKQLIEAKQHFSLILLDLGVSSPQLDLPERGFSFTNSGPLDMRMDVRQSKTANEMVNRLNLRELTQIIHRYGEEPMRAAQRYARAIIEARPLESTEELASVIKQAHVGRWKKIHPATRTFQAIRIAVNDELGQIEAIMPLLPRLLKPGGRVAVISFHSLEDRIVKRYFAEQRQSGLEAELDVLTKKPIHGDTDDVHNLRARSAKLRAAVKK